MAALRARLSWFVTLWLLCQAVILAAAPFALCCRTGMMVGVEAAADASAAADECPLHAPPAVTDQSTPADAELAAAAHADAHQAPCAMESTCTPSDPALESLLGTVAVLPSVHVVSSVDTSSTLVLVATPVHPHTPLHETPPPEV